MHLIRYYIFPFMLLNLSATAYAAESTVEALSARPTQAVPVAQPIQQPIQQLWQIKRGVELRSQLDAWATRAGWNLIWESEYAYVPQVEAAFTGTFISAVTDVFAALQAANPPLYPVLYQGNQVLLVKGQPAQ
ncbi:MAG: toxin co-regulated pilus biosynthesis Q family protein [Pseudomonas sp.]|uniref:toxin co-regulated pilus biosynthesis Q family protein n=1 Tax=Pseudomonas sp. TaxID=306 RepID=UPI003BB58DEF